LDVQVLFQFFKGRVKDGKWLYGALFFIPERTDYLLVSGITTQQISRGVFKGDDMSPVEEFSELLIRAYAGFIQPLSIRVGHPEVDTTGVTAVGLGMEAPVCRLSVLLEAFRAHPEDFHTGMFPFKGKGLSKGPAGSAIYTADKRVPVPAVLRIH
jgi:hypothetical protein